MYPSYNRILSSRDNQIEVVINELEEIKEKFGDDRRTEITNSDASIDDEDLIPQEDIVITLSRGGYVKRLNADTFRTQNRGGRGVRGASLNENDVVELMIYTKTHTDLLFFTDLGKVYRIRGYQVPEYQRTGKGVPVINLINIEKGENVKSIIAVNEYRDDRFLMFFTTEGIVKRTPLKEYESIRQNGKIAITLREGDNLLNVKQVSEHNELEQFADENGEFHEKLLVGIAASNGKMVNFPVDEVRPMGRSASGVKGIELGHGARVVGTTASYEGDHILVVTDKGYGKMTKVIDNDGEPTYRITKRGTKGVSTLKASDKVGNLVAVRAVNLDDDLMVITNAGIVIRTPLNQIRVASRNTQGVKIMNLEGRQRVSSIAIVPHEEPAEEVEATEESEVVEEEFVNPEE